MTKNEELRRAFILGFMVSREGFNGECCFDHCSPNGVEAHYQTVEGFFADVAMGNPDAAVGKYPRLCELAEEAFPGFDEDPSITDDELPRVGALQADEMPDGPETCTVCGGEEPCSPDFDRITWPNADQNWTDLKELRVLAEQADCILADRGRTDFPDVDLPQYDKETKHFARAVLLLLAHCSKSGHNVAGAVADMVNALKGGV